MTTSILVTDVVGSTSLRTSRGDVTAHQIMAAHFDLVREQIERHSGAEVKTTGDGFMVAFTSARQAVACATGVQASLSAHNQRRPDDAVEVRIGLNTGEAIEEDGDLFGAAVDAAHRIAAKAKAGQVLVSEATRSVIGPGGAVRFSDRGRFRLKGFPIAGASTRSSGGRRRQLRPLSSRIGRRSSAARRSGRSSATSSSRHSAARDRSS